MTVFILFLSGRVIKSSTDLNELKEYVLAQLQEHNTWNYAANWHYIGYEILDVWVPLPGQETVNDDN